MPIAFWCMLAAGILPILTVAVAKWSSGYDNREPRGWSLSLDGHRRRAFAAHQNGFEAFPFFAAAVLVATFLEASQGVIDALALAFVAARIGYTACYIADWPTQRSIMWSAGWLATIAIFIAPVWAASR